MLLEEFMRLAIVPVLAMALVASGCDRQSPPAAQGNVSADASAISQDEVQPDPAGAPAPKADKIDRSQAGTAAPAYAFTDSTGKSLTLAAFRGKPTLVNLWATWCAPCVKELPTIDALAAREAGKLNVLAISQDMDATKVAPFLASRDLKRLAVYTDPGMAWVPAVSPTLPTTILYSSDGKEVLRVVGDMDWAGAEAAKAIAEAK